NIKVVRTCFNDIPIQRSRNRSKRFEFLEESIILGVSKVNGITFRGDGRGAESVKFAVVFNNNRPVGRCKFVVK
ncbi:MAG: hypothetical protein K8R53_02830, partial [Bacteroidales bacterium]|nr:hypothetical protein [Bacteroidales bacterium]